MYFDILCHTKGNLTYFPVDDGWWLFWLLGQKVTFAASMCLIKYLVSKRPVHRQARSNINPLNPHSVKAVGSRAAPWPLTCSRSSPHPQPLSEFHYQPIIVIQWDAACVVACRAHIEKHIKANTNLQLWLFTQCGGLFTLIRLRAADVKTIV